MVYEEDFGTAIGVFDDVRNGVRPLVVAGGDEFGLRLVNPLNPNEIFAEAPPPLSTFWEEPGEVDVISGDFDGDGAMELVVLGVPAGGIDDEFAVLDGTTLGTLAYRGQIDGYTLKVGVLDIDGNGVDELITGDVGDPGVTFGAWSLKDGELSLVAMDFFGVRCDEWSFMRGDYDADGHADLAIVWHEDCEDYFRIAGLGPPQIITLLGGSAPKAGLGFRYSPQQVSMLQAAVGNFDDDMDAEIVIAESVQNLTIFDWTSSGFVGSQSFSVGDYESISFGKMLPGGFSLGSPDGVLVGALFDPGSDDLSESFYAGLFPNSGNPGLVIVLPHTPTLVGDFNLDGVADFRTALGLEYGVYLSVL